MVLHDAIPRGMQRPHDPATGPLFVQGKGSRLWDASGKDYFDLTCSYSSTNFGHAHPDLIQVAADQLQRLSHLTGQAHPWRNELCAQLAARVDVEPPCKVWLSTTGARAIEIAWKIAFARKPGSIFSFDNAFHGRSIATSYLSQTARMPILENTNSTIAAPIMPFADCERCRFQQTPDRCSLPCLDSFESYLKEKGSTVSALLIEPVIGARGYLFAHRKYFHRLEQLARKHDILLIADEIQTGLGRFGAFLASHRQDWRPDLTSSARASEVGSSPYRL